MSTFYENHLFRSFDCNKDGILDFFEFVQALSTLQRGTAQDKLNWIFRMYDIDGDGEITKDEFVEIVSSARIIRSTHLEKYNDADFVESNERGKPNALTNSGEEETKSPPRELSG